jgi:hypothetical protein
MFLFLIIYIIQFFIIGIFISYWLALAILFCSYPAGVFTINYIKQYYLFRGSLYYLRLFIKRTEMVVKLKTMRNQLVDQLEEGRMEYLKALELEEI